jgi:hypothetical protein
MHQTPDSNVLSLLNKLQCWKCTNPELQADPPTPNVTTTTMDPLIVDDNVNVCDTLLCSIVPTHPDMNGEFFECAAGVLCKARHQNNTFGTHMSWCCNKMIHSHVTCGMQLDDYISKNLNHVGYVFDSGRAITMDDDNERRVVCSSCISIKSPTPSDPHIYNNVDGQPTISNPIAIPLRNMGGCPKGSTKAKKKMMAVKAKHAINWIAMQYNELKIVADAENKTASKRIRVRDGALEGLITKAKSEFGLNNDFVVHKNTIWNRINTGNLEVMHPGEQSLLLHVETILKSYLITAADL